MVRMPNLNGAYTGEGAGPWMVKILDLHGSYSGESAGKGSRSINMVHTVDVLF